MGCGGYSIRDAGNWTVAVARWTKAGAPNRPQGVVVWIEKNCCRECDQNSMGRCKSCGCNVSKSSVPLWNKIKMATENCPHGRWPPTELIIRCLKGELPMSKIETIVLPTIPGLYWAIVRKPQVPMPNQPQGPTLGPVRAGPSQVQAGEPELKPDEAEENYNAILAIWCGPTSSSFRTFLFGEQGESRRTVSKRDIVRIGDRIEVPQ